ncbi:hypothetical protein [Legionella yabuuchiae]|uniref:hypothetical protein n=1 Tax=Legionella yabuuchiae TaxID=376727 RepID=UPI001054824C|nr:hypothetical protein [Legionella yabuuchiae]
MWEKVKAFFIKDLPDFFNRFVVNPFLNHWKVITTVAVASLATALCLVYPPMALSLAIFALASSPAMAAFGSGAVLAATTLVASAVALTVASVFGLIFGTKKLLDMFFNKSAGRSQSTEEEVSPSLRNLSNSPSSLYDETLGEEPGQYPSPFAAERRTRPALSIDEYDSLETDSVASLLCT